MVEDVYSKDHLWMGEGLGLGMEEENTSARMVGLLSILGNMLPLVKAENFSDDFGDGLKLPLWVRRVLLTPKVQGGGPEAYQQLLPCLGRTPQHGVWRYTYGSMGEGCACVYFTSESRAILGRKEMEKVEA